jgi:hypothetical protein
MGTTAMSVPESPEVVSQTSKEIIGLYRLFCATENDKHREAVSGRVEALVRDPARAIRLAKLWASLIVEPIRHQFDLSVPGAGIYLSPADPETPLEDGETFAGMFVTAALHHDDQTADQVVHDLGGLEPDQLRIFMGLLLAMVANTE